MKASFFHDTPLIKGTDNKIYSRSFTYEVWKRYLMVFEELTVSTRLRFDKSPEQNIIKNLKISSGPNVKIQPITEYKKNSDMLFNRKKITNQIKKSLNQTDCAIIRLPSFIGNIAFKEAKKMNKPFLIEVVGCAWDAYWNYNILGKIIALPSYLYMKKAVKNAEYVVYVTNEFLQKRYPTLGKSTNCSNVQLNDFNNSILEKRLHKIKKLNKNSKIIIGTTAAVDVKYKGQQYVIKALAKLKEEGITNFEYQLVGGGDQTYLKTVVQKYKINDQVKFLGSMQHDKVFQWLDTIDIYVQPSRQEGLPRALIEAMSRGVPALGAKTAGIPELLQEEYLFSNSRKNINEICTILKNITKENLLLQAKRNFNESKKYDRNIIEDRRYRFLKKFSKQFYEKL